MMWSVESEDLLITESKDEGEEDEVKDNKFPEERVFGWDRYGDLFGISAREVRVSTQRKQRSLYCLRFRIRSPALMQSNTSLLKSEGLSSPLGLLLRIHCQLTHPAHFSISCYNGKEGEEGKILQHARFHFRTHHPSVPSSTTTSGKELTSYALVIKCINMKIGYVLEGKLVSSLDSAVTVQNVSIIDVDVPMEVAESYGSRPYFQEMHQFDGESWINSQVASLCRHLHSLAKVIKSINGYEAAEDFLAVYQSKSCAKCQEEAQRANSSNQTYTLQSNSPEQANLTSNLSSLLRLPRLFLCSAKDCGGAVACSDYYHTTLETPAFRAAVRWRFDQYVSPTFDLTRWRQRDRLYRQRKERFLYEEEKKYYDRFHLDKRICPKCQQIEPYDSHLYKEMVNEGKSERDRYRSQCSNCEVYYVQPICWKAEEWQRREESHLQRKISKVEALREQVARAAIWKDSYVPPPMFKDTLGEKLHDPDSLLLLMLTKKGERRFLHPEKYRKSRRRQKQKRKSLSPTSRQGQQLVALSAGGCDNQGVIPEAEQTNKVCFLADMTDSIGTSFLTNEVRDQLEEPGVWDDTYNNNNDDNDDGNMNTSHIPNSPLEDYLCDLEQKQQQQQQQEEVVQVNDPEEERKAEDGQNVVVNRANSDGLSEAQRSLQRFSSSFDSRSADHSDFDVEVLTTALSWKSGISGLNPTPLVNIDHPARIALCFKGEILVRVPCLHSSRHRILKPWDSLELLDIKPQAKQRESPGNISSTSSQAHSLSAASSQHGNFVSIRYFYTLCDENNPSSRPAIALPSVSIDAYSIFHWHRCEYPCYPAEEQSRELCWQCPTAFQSDEGEESQHVKEMERDFLFRSSVSSDRCCLLPVNAVFSVTLVPAKDLDLNILHYVMNRSVGEDELVYELVFPVQAINHETEEIMVGNFRVCLDPPLRFMEEVEGLNDVIHVHSKHHKVFIQQLMRRMKIMSRSFALSEQLRDFIGPVATSYCASFTVNEDVSFVPLDQIAFLSEFDTSSLTS
eukprot:scaffold3044_cov176-Ochromonas_danica.AAC.5